MSSRDNHLWLQLWREQHLDFHELVANRFLTRFWPGIDHLQGSRVFVPLCGKSTDMIWLAEQGHEVVGVELSPIAVKAFFKENKLQPVKRRVGSFTQWRHNHISILCGDYFALDKTILGHVDTVYDRAALTALPEDVRKLYVAHLQRLMPATSDVFLLTIEDTEDDALSEQLPQVDEEIKALYAAAFDIRLSHAERVFETNPEAQDQPPRQAEYKVYRLCGRKAVA